MRHPPLRALLLTLVAVALAAGAHASSLDPGPSLGYTPRVPISALARPVSAIDLSRFHVSTMVSVGSGSGWGGGTQALQVTSLSYQFKAPVTMRVSIGNAWGSQAQGGSQFFLEGADLSFRPSANSFLQISYQNVRSPLQYGYSPFYAPYWAR
jgi:hypothetical protein